MVKLTDIASHVGVSPRTVSVVLNGRGPKNRISRARIQQIRKAADQLGYRPSSAARNLRSQRSQQIGVLIRNRAANRFTHPLAWEFILGINEGLQQAGYLMVVARIDDVEADLADQSRVFSENALDAMIVLDFMPEAIEYRLGQLFRHTVWCDSNVWRDVGCIRRDERHAGRIVGDAAADLGYRQLAWLTYPDEQAQNHFSSVQRLSGLRETTEPHDIQVHVSPESQLHQPTPDTPIIQHMAAGGLVVADSIYQAQRLHRAGEKFDLRPGVDYGLMSTDDWQHLNRYWPDLSRATFDRFAMGVAAAAMALRMVDDGPDACPSRLMPGPFHPGDTARGPDPHRD
jgi:DNA-binding LacI/PurR family transcriptional regulator